MATSTIRDTILRFLVKREGDKELKELSKEVLDVGDSASQSQGKLAGFIDQISNSQKTLKAIENFRELGRRVLDLAQQVTNSKTKIAELGKAISDSEAPTKKQTRELEQNRVALQKLETQLGKAKSALGEARRELQSSGVQVTRLNDAERNLAASTRAAEAGIRALAASVRSAAAEEQRLALRTQDAAERAERLERANRASAEALARLRGQASPAATEIARVGTAARQSSSWLDLLKGAAAGVVATLSFDRLARSSAEILKVGDNAYRTQLQLSGLYGSAEGGSRAFARLMALARENSLQFTDLLGTVQRLKAFGLEPMDGTLQAVIDQTARLGGSTDILERIVLALGQAWTKTRLQGEEIRQLVEAGVPVYDLLSKATGKSAKELQNLSEQGRIGRDMIRKLIDEMGLAAKGAAAINFSTMQGQINGLTDRINKFFIAVSNAGALKFFRDMIASVNAKIDEMAKSGALDDLAVRVSQTFIAIGNAVKGTIKFLYDHAAAIMAVAKAYAFFKTIQLVGVLTSNTRALYMMAAGLTEVDGKVVQVSKRVPGFLGLLGRIPKSLLITVALVGFELAVKGAEKLAEKLAENNEAAESAAAARQKMTDTLLEEARGYAQVAANLSEFAKVNALTAEQIGSLSELERTAYQQRIQGLNDYLEAKFREGVRLREIGQLSRAELDLIVKDLDAARRAMGDFEAGSALAAQALENKLSGAAQTVVNSFKGMSGTLGQINSFVGGLLKNIDEIDNTKLGDIALGISAVAQQSDLAAKGIADGLANVLEDLSGEQMLRFQSNAQAAFDQFDISSEQSSAVLDATLLAAMKRLGVSSLEYGLGMQQAGRNAVAAFQTVVENANASGRQIEISYRAAIKAATSTEEVEALGRSFTTAAAQGRVGMESVERAALDLQNRIEDLRAANDPLAESYRQLGIKSSAALNAARDSARTAMQQIVKSFQEGNASIADVTRAFRAYAEAAIAAAVDTSESNQKQVQQQLEIQAAVLGLSKVMEESGIAGKLAGSKTAEGFDQARQSIEGAAAAAEGLADSTASVVGALNETAAAAEESADRSREAAEGVMVLTGEQLTGLRRIGEQLFNNSITGQQYQEKMQDLFQGTNTELERQVAYLERLNQLQSSLEQELLQEQGDEEGLENLRHEEALKNIEEEATYEGTLDFHRYNQLKQLEDELHRRKLDNIQQQQREEQQRREEEQQPAETSEPPETPRPAERQVNLNLKLEIESTSRGEPVSLSPETIRQMTATMLPEIMRRLNQERGLT